MGKDLVSMYNLVSLKTVFESWFGLFVLFIFDIFSFGRLENDLVIIRKYLGVMICAEPKRAASSDIHCPSDKYLAHSTPSNGLSRSVNSSLIG